MRHVGLCYHDGSLCHQLLLHPSRTITSLLPQAICLFSTPLFLTAFASTRRPWASFTCAKYSQLTAAPNLASVNTGELEATNICWPTTKGVISKVRTVGLVPCLQKQHHPLLSVPLSEPTPQRPRIGCANQICCKS